MPYPTLDLVNQFGEQSTNYITGGTGASNAPIAATSLEANLTASVAAPTVVTLQALVNKAPAKAAITAISNETLGNAITIALSTSNTYTDAAVNTAVNAALVTVVAEINAAIAQINSILIALKVVS